MENIRDSTLTPGGGGGLQDSYLSLGVVSRSHKTQRIKVLPTAMGHCACWKGSNIMGPTEASPRGSTCQTFPRFHSNVTKSAHVVPSGYLYHMLGFRAVLQRAWVPGLSIALGSKAERPAASAVRSQRRAFLRKAHSWSMQCGGPGGVGGACLSQ